MPTLRSLLAVSVALSCAAQAAYAVELETAFAEQADSVRAASSKIGKDCSEAKELETRFELKVTFPGGAQPLDISFTYSGCREEGRNDYLPPYTDRGYEGRDGYALTIVTEEGESKSEVLLSHDKEWFRFGKIANASLVSGDLLTVGKLLTGTATLRGVPRELSEKFPQLKACDAEASKLFTYYGAGRLMLLTDAGAYYYHEDCDICAAIDVCDLKTHAMKNIVSAHSAGCSDLAPYRKGTIFFDSCK